MRIVWFIGVLVSLVPLVTLGVFNGLTIVGLIIVGFATWRIIKKEGLS
jgi:hypothetical protein